ncbi:unnamed protein product [Bursaphelenchus okinawaensis]|uniref:CRAL-TRIO domain-containing protein n=1 Tax=Bursaphelenchus okinawaensis TaxID=465554 RepID=A0A811L9A5_9BILA|nr:unnamed protein product [Bursaphelenchus okinawaensis]CAG9119748.1 unnamed protein product [Bursaphelenchus okinawaensis]
MPEKLLCQPEPFTDAELAKASDLRQRLQEVLPKEFDSDFSIGRWLRAYKDDEQGLITRLKELLEHRRTLGYNEENILDFCETFPVAKKTFERFAISQLKMDVFSGDVGVFCQKMENVDIKEVMRVMPLSNVLHSYFLLHECFHRVMHQRERETGRQHAVVVVLDLSGINLADFINPLSTSSKLARLVVKIWSDYFSENMIRLFLLHPPALLSLMWQVAKHIVDEKTRSRLVFIQKLDDIFLHLSRDSIPEDWQGTRRDDSGYAVKPSSCCRAPKPIEETDFFNADKYWNEYGFQKPPVSKSITLKSKACHEVTKEVRSGQLLIWLFTISCDAAFEIVYVDGGNETTVWPKVTLTSLKIPEIGNVTCDKSGTYKFKFQNVSGSWLSSKLQYTIQTK